MSNAEPMDLVIADLQISAISDTELEETFHRVLAEHRDAVASIHQSMKDADAAYRKYLEPGFEPVEEEAKKDRANLNRAEKNIAEKFASLKAAYERPLERIELNIREIRNAIKNASGVVDSKVKAYEETQKTKKRGEILAYFESKKCDLVSLDRIFDSKWLNKGAKMKDIREQIDAAIAAIYSNIKILENIADHGTAAKAFYLETLDMGEAMRRVETLKANAERLAREQAEREERENRERVARNAEAERREEQRAAKEEKVKSLVAEALDLPEPEAPVQPEIMEFTLRFRGTREQLLKLREYMTATDISYEKGHVFERAADAEEYRNALGLNAPVCYAVFDAA